MGSVSEEAREGTEAVAIASAIQIDPEKVRRHVDEVVRGTVEQTLNALLDAEADQLCNAGRYERSPDRQDTRAGSYERKLATKAGEVKLKVSTSAENWFFRTLGDASRHDLMSDCSRARFYPAQPTTFLGIQASA